MKEDLMLQWETCSQKMQELMDQLPSMEAKNTVYQRLLLASQVTETTEEFEKLCREQERMQQEYEKYEKAGNQGLAAYIQNQMGYRSGPRKERKAHLDGLLEKGGFSNPEEAQDFLSRSEPLEQLRQQIESFQQEYAQTLERCRQLDEQLSAEENV